jgi:enamine deaminase RidA (YjgF/YER057c/UK114 family)
VGCRVEIALTLLAGDAPITTVEATAVPEPVWHEPQAIHAGDLLFLSNRLALDERGHVPAALTEDGGFRHLHEAGRAQAAHILGDISAICEAAGSSLDQLCRRTTFYDGLRHFAGMAAESRPHFPDRTAPASIDIEVGREWPLLVPGARMIVDAIAYAPS